MPRSRVSLSPERIRIEDEVWQEAFARREPSPARAARRLRAVEGGLAEFSVPRPLRARRPSAPPATEVARRADPTTARRADTTTARAAATSPVAAEPPAESAAPAPTRLAGPRTVTIRGRGAERNLPWPDAPQRRPQRRAYERTGFRPDRVAMWAVLLGVLLVLVAVLSSHG